MKSSDLLDDFTDYCRDNPELRFWQALRNWSGHNFLLAAQDKPQGTKDTFYWEARNGISRSVDAN